MAFSYEPLPSSVGTVIRGVDATRLSAEDKKELRRAFLENSVLLLRETRLTQEAHVALTWALGEPEIHPIATGRLEDYPEILVPKPYGAEHTDDPEEIVGRIPWHADLTYTTTPSRGALLRGLEIPPEGGETGFVDTAAVYEALSDSKKDEIGDLKVVHNMLRAQRLLGLNRDEEATRQVAAQFPPIVQPLVFTDPVSGTRSLNISPMFADEVLDVDAGYGADLLKELAELATQDRFVYYHQWQQEDLLIWNNYRTIHSACGHKQKYERTMNRTTVKGEVESGYVLESVRAAEA